MQLAIIGASYLQLPLVHKAKELGIVTHCFAWEEGAVCKDAADFFYPISILEKEQILAVCQDRNIDGITTIATDMAVPVVSFVAQQMGLTGNSTSTAENATNKAKMRRAFDIGNVKSPRYSIADAVPAVEFKFPVIVKPVDRSGSRGVVKIESPDSLPNAIAIAISESFAGQAIIEEFIEGREVSVETISWHGKHYVLAVTDKVTTGAPHFVELAHHQPAKLAEPVLKRVTQQTIMALKALDVQFGAGHTELKITSSGEVFVIETGARMGGDFIGSHLVELSTGYDYLKGVIDVAFGKFTPPQMSLNAFSGVYFLCKETEKLIPYFENKTTFEIAKAIQDKDLKVLTNSNDRSGFLIYQSTQRIELL